MLRLKNILWITFAFCVTTGSCTEYYGKIGDEVKLECPGLILNSEIEWKLNNMLLLSQYKTGRQRKGTSDTCNRARIEGTALRISALKPVDSGVYTCKTSSHLLYVATAKVSPPSVLIYGETKLSCDVPGNSKINFQWLTPKSKPHGNGKEVTVKPVITEHAGVWTCQVKNEKENLIELKVNVDVVGPLITSGNVEISEGDNAELPCFLRVPPRKPIIGGSWRQVSPSRVHLLALMMTESGLKWNTTGAKKDKVDFNGLDLREVFNVTLKKVRPSDAGVYQCSLEFEGGYLSANLSLAVLKRDTSSPESKILNKHVGGMQLWVWIAIGASCFVLIGLVVIILLIYCRNKRLKRKMRKLNSMRQPRNYCMCDRTRRQPGKSPGKRERPPPLPRHQYRSLNE